MARKVIWTETAWRDLERSADYIAEDSPGYAAAFVLRIRESARSLDELTLRGRVVPEAVLRGHYRYYGVPLNIRKLQRFRWHVQRLWQRSLARRSQKGRVTFARMERLARHWLPLARIYHLYPAQRFHGTTQGRSPVR
jgi:plasmid stabilization system protein ParE